MFLTTEFAVKSAKIPWNLWVDKWLFINDLGKMGVSSHFSETLDDVIYFEGLDLGLKGLLKRKKSFQEFAPGV